jgi:hypothetical protein
MFSSHDGGPVEPDPIRPPDPPRYASRAPRRRFADTILQLLVLCTLVAVVLLAGAALVMLVRMARP